MYNEYKWSVNDTAVFFILVLLHTFNTINNTIYFNLYYNII